MADVLFVCVGADAARAEELAEVFEYAGFSISEENVSAQSIARARVCVIVWSRAAMESPRFNTAMADAISADKAVIACFSGPDDIALAAPTFDISAWSGDPDDAVLDDLFNTVDRMAPHVVTPEEACVSEPTREPAPVVRLVAETPVPKAAAPTSMSKPKRARKKKRKPHAEFDPLRLSRERSHLRLVHGALAAILIGGFAFANLAPARSAEPAVQAVAQIPAETMSLIPGAQSFTMDDLLSDRPLPPMPELAEGIGPVALASVESFDITPVQPLRPRRAARLHLASAEAPSESEKIEALAVAYVEPASLTPAAFAPEAEADKPEAKPHV